MGGLLIKELLYTKKQGKIILLMLAISLMPLLDRHGKYPKFARLYILDAVFVMVEILIMINSFTCDEAAKWDVFALSMPVGISSMVGAK